MDTRGKIVDLERARALARGGGLRAVAGYFDVLLAGHARALAGLRKPGVKLLAIVADPPDPVLPAAARAELAASLAAVDYVVCDPAGAVLSLFPDAVRLETADLERRRELIARVQGRHAG